MEGECLIEALGERITRDVGEGDEEPKLEKEYPDGQKQKGLVSENPEIWMRADILRRRKPFLQKKIRYDEQAQADEPEDADRPTPAHTDE